MSLIWDLQGSSRPRVLSISPFQCHLRGLRWISHVEIT